MNEFERRQAAKISALYGVVDTLQKGGEGSRGGRVIGRTRSGNPIYDSHGHESHKNFTPEDHRDAIKAHKEEYEGHKEDFNMYKNSGQVNHPDAREPKAMYEHHKEQMRLHRGSLKN